MEEVEKEVGQIESSDLITALRALDYDHIVALEADFHRARSVCVDLSKTCVILKACKLAGEMAAGPAGFRLQASGDRVEVRVDIFLAVADANCGTPTSIPGRITCFYSPHSRTCQSRRRSPTRRPGVREEEAGWQGAQRKIGAGLAAGCSCLCASCRRVLLTPFGFRV